MLTPIAWLAPHIPTLLVDQHRGHRTEMLEALAEASRQLLESRPRAAVVVSARWQSSGPFMVDAGRKHETLTDYSGFGVEVRYDCDGDPALARALVDAGGKAGLRVATSKRGVDSGVTVPMHFLAPERGVAIVPLSVANRGFEECRAWGASIRRTLAARPEPVALVVGGLLSFDPHAWGLGREVVVQREFDERLLQALRAGRWAAIGEERQALLKAGRRARGEAVQLEGDLRHLEILRGYLGGDLCGDVRCYETSPGVGAALVGFALQAEAADAGAAADASGARSGDEQRDREHEQS